MAKRVVVVDSGSGNLRSVERALLEVGAEPVLSGDAEVVAAADRLCVPGQGAFGDCVTALREHGLGEAIRQVIDRGNPYFGICLGMQLLFDGSDESPGAAGFGLLPGHVKRFDPSVGKVPHMGWNTVSIAKPDALFDGIADKSYFYFIHSYYVDLEREEHLALRADYGSGFTAAVRKDNVFACQFHPEKSQGAGLKLLSNWMASC